MLKLRYNSHIDVAICYSRNFRIRTISHLYLTWSCFLNVKSQNFEGERIPNLLKVFPVILAGNYWFPLCIVEDVVSYMKLLEQEIEMYKVRNKGNIENKRCSAIHINSKNVYSKPPPLTCWFPIVMPLYCFRRKQ